MYRFRYRLATYSSIKSKQYDDEWQLLYADDIVLKQMKRESMYIYA